jgi:mono/diheme cytochrome c family protein
MLRLRRPALKFVLVGTLVLAASLGARAQGVRAPGSASSAAMKSSLEAGHDLFRAHCMRCHGVDARGTADGPNLLLRVKGMSEAAFVSAVLQRYRWTLPAAEGAGESEAREAMIRGVLSRPQDGSNMPAWESDPRVSQGVKALYEYLSTQAR